MLLVAAIAPTASAAIATMDADHNVSPEAAQAILHVGDAFFPAAFMAMSVPIGATALWPCARASCRAGSALPRS